MVRIYRRKPGVKKTSSFSSEVVLESEDRPERSPNDDFEMFKTVKLLPPIPELFEGGYSSKEDFLARVQSRIDYLNDLTQAKRVHEIDELKDIYDGLSRRPDRKK